jgi:hypothetical protein
MIEKKEDVSVMQNSSRSEEVLSSEVSAREVKRPPLWNGQCITLFQVRACDG